MLSLKSALKIFVSLFASALKAETREPLLSWRMNAMLLLEAEPITEREHPCTHILMSLGPI